ncbi:hypothetical protein CHS0354_038284 [Potamilus streckersoni]|uniref:Uncharacterized protein n=1 Tax=Potamilus streckersoni TaxID=2493646 RepID=A0AAE0TCU2_9BIVA|nr:hypothetical protein CHS0354_038284 [Potamilus streckersoni]
MTEGAHENSVEVNTAVSTRPWPLNCNRMEPKSSREMYNSVFSMGKQRQRTKKIKGLVVKGRTNQGDKGNNPNHREPAISTPEDNNYQQQLNLPKNQTLGARPKFATQDNLDYAPNTSTSQEVPHDVVEADLEMSSSSSNKEIEDEEGVKLLSAFYKSVHKDYPLYQLTEGATYLAAIHSYNFPDIIRQEKRMADKCKKAEDRSGIFS